MQMGKNCDSNKFDHNSNYHKRNLIALSSNMENSLMRARVSVEERGRGERWEIKKERDKERKKDGGGEIESERAKGKVSGSIDVIKKLFTTRGYSIWSSRVCSCSFQ